MSEVIVASDRLPARLIKPHTHEKFYLHRRYCSIFNSGMQKQWPRNRGYLELFAGSGLAYDAITGAEHEASPILAATLNSPGFSRLAFVEYDQELAHALEARLRSRGIADGRARVFAGDANDRYVLARALAFLPDPGLIFVFADPEDINFWWSSVQILAAARRQRKDLMINLPIGPMRREIGNRRYGSTARFLGTNEWITQAERGDDLGDLLRQTYADQLGTLGFTARHKAIHAATGNLVLYDLVFASRSPRALEFWHKIQEIGVSGQRELKLFPDFE